MVRTVLDAIFSVVPSAGSGCELDGPVSAAGGELVEETSVPWRVCRDVEGEERE